MEKKELVCKLIYNKVELTGKDGGEDSARFKG